MMRSSYRDYLNFIWQGLDGRAVIALMDSDNQITRHKFFSWPDQSEDLFAYVEEHKGQDVYTTDTLYRANRAKKGVAKAVQMVFSDADTFNVADAKLIPSLIVHTSPGKTHLHWRLTDTTDPSVVEPLSHALSNAHPKDTTGMDDGWAVNKFLRVPGTANTNPMNKPGYPDNFEVSYETTGAAYTSAEFAAAYPPVETVTVAEKTLPDVLPGYGEVLGRIKNSPMLSDLINKGAGSRRDVDRSDALFLLENELFRLGATDEETFVICRNAAVNKFADKSDPDSKLWDDILRARAKSYTTSELEEADDTIEVTVAPHKPDKMVDFLTEEEKENLRPTFVDDYMAWAASKTDAAREYHVAGAFTILSTVFSDYGHAVPKFGRLPLNMWFMVLGATTRSRKSTTRGQMLKFISALSDDDKYTYDLGSDFTPEALDNALLERSNRSGLVHRDEFQGFLKEVGSKAYMAGAEGKLTEIYDGHVSGKLRATGEQKRKAAVNVSLVLFAMGIRDQVADILTQEDFQSGFLTRFIYIEADAPPRTKESDYLAQADLTEVKEGDPVFTQLLQSLEKSRQHWDNFVQYDAPTTAVPCTPEAWARLNAFISDVLDAAEGHERHAIIDASSQRLTLSILKAATLLAMYESCDEVELNHMLAAINYCASWFTHMVSMANRVSASAWQRRMDAVEEFLMEKGGSATWEVVYRKFKSDLKSREFLEIITALEEAGVLHTYHSDEKLKRRFIELLDQGRAA